ncbi:MAG: hypothetical protein J6O61_18950 [Butyrivibrio sp.]|uniref:ABC transporter substrate-binding protein n=1 Tax=Butyrivibrio sp. TaxID=28121 RepID=UPI001B178121|nr:hypothetical protein [Butyrivibrio sp.]MBO6242882.1 hypothetical protein [Butyrivibrio sp.]
MKRSKFLKKAGTIALAMTMVVGTLSGCGKEKSGSDDSILNEASTGSKDYVFKIADLGIDIDAKNISTVKIVGDKVYAVDFYGSVDKGVAVNSFNYDGSGLSTVYLPNSDGESYSHFNFDVDGNIYAIEEIYHWEDDEMHIMDDEENTDNASDEASDDFSDLARENSSVEDEAGDSALSENSLDDANTESSEETDDKMIADDGDGYAGSMYESSEEERYVVKFDASGNLIYKYDINKDLAEGDYLQIYGMIYSDKYGVVMNTGRGIEFFDENNGFKLVYDTTKSEEYKDCYLDLYKGFNGDIFLAGYGNDGYVIAPVDLEKGEIGQKAAALEHYNSMTVFEGNGYDLYISTESAIYGYDFKADKLTKIMDYVDSDLSADYSISSIVAISDTEFLAVLPDFEYNYNLERLVKVPADQVKDKQIITLGGVYIDYSVRKAAVKFNQENQDYKIKLVDYSVYDSEDNWDEGTNRFNLDVVSGNVPDIMAFNTESPVDSFINKGLFLDLNAFIKNDPDISGTEFIDNVIDAFKTGDKMYLMIPSFSIATVAMKKSRTGGKETLTINDVENLIEESGAGYNLACGPQNRQELMNYGIAYSGNKFIDWENKKCNFTDENFIKLLEFTKNFPEEYDESIWDKNLDEIYRTNEGVLYFTGIYGFDQYKRIKYGTFGEDVAFVGFPNERGENYSTILPSVSLAVSARSKYTDGIWQFLRTFYLDEYQNNIEFNFPVTKSAFEKKAKESMETKYYTDENGDKQEEIEYYWIGDQEVKLPNLTKEDVQFVENFVYSLSEPMTYNANVNNIIMEEASAFFSGQKSAEEVANIIQSRLSIYVNENS